MDPTRSYRILELGGGQSTLFWKSLCQQKLIPIEVITLEHDQRWSEELSSRIGYMHKIQVTRCIAQKLYLRKPTSV